MDSHMSAHDKLAKAKRIIESLQGDVDRAIASNALFTRCAFKNDINNAVNNTMVAHGFTRVRESLYVDLVVALMRIRGGEPRDDDATLPAVMKLLSDKDVQAALREDARKRRLTRPHVYLGKPDPKIESIIEESRRKSAEKSADEVVRKIRSAIRTWPRHENDEIVKKLCKLRNKHVAHSTLDPSPHGVRYSDLTLVLSKTIPIVEKLLVNVTGVQINFSESGKIWQTRAGYFWRHVAKGPFETRVARSMATRRKRGGRATARID